MHMASSAVIHTQNPRITMYYTDTGVTYTLNTPSASDNPPPNSGLEVRVQRSLMTNPRALFGVSPAIYLVSEPDPGSETTIYHGGSD